MDHVAIMRKSWGLLPKILGGEKTIESRFYKNKVAPWNKIFKGDTVYFKNSGEAVSVKAEIIRVLEISELDSEKTKKILETYGKDLGISRGQLKEFYKRIEESRYAVLIFLDKARKIKSFQISKTGFGLQAAWICVPSIDQVKIR